MDPISAYGVLMLVAGLQIKHMVFDGPAQTRWMIAGKGTYGTWGGFAHSGAHLVGSLAVLLVLSVPLTWALLLAVADGAVHYHIDFFKEQAVKGRKLTPANQSFWWILAMDQLLHHFTYIAIAAVLITWSA
jgi:Protein of unknown function (DUF3307)